MKHSNLLLNAILKNDIKELQRLLEEGVPIDTPDRDGRSALFQAVVDGNFDVVRLLVEHSANVNHRDTKGKTPLHFAAGEVQNKIAAYLLSQGAEIDAQDDDGNTPLSDAIFYSQGNGNVISLLIQHGADKSLKNKYDISPVDLAKSIANYDVLRFLT